MRISTANAYDSGIATLMQRQLDMTTLQNQMTTGKRVNQASDDPAAAAIAARAVAAQSQITATQRAVAASQTVMTQTESSLGDAGNLLQSARALLVQAGNATLSDTDRQSIATQLQSIRGQLVDIANTSNGAGSYIFGGQGSTQKPFIETPGGVQYAAAPGQTLAGGGTNLPLTTDGNAVWMTAPTGNGVFATSAGPGVTDATIDTGSVSDPSALTGANYTLSFTVSGGVTTYAVLKNGAPTAVTAAPYVSGQAIVVDGMTVAVSGTPSSGDQFQIAPSTPTQSVFGTLDKAISDLSTPGRTGSQVAQSNAETLQSMDAVMNHLEAARGVAGDVLNSIANFTDRLNAQNLAATTTQSNAEDVDMVSAISTFQNEQNGYDAALKSYAMVQRLSLFQYVNGG
ncbi:MAG TPA: flagellar hook-associated protein FlgL [Caldimonas sp.]